MQFMKDVRKNGDIKLVTTEKRKKNYLVLEPNYHNKQFFTENLLGIQIRKPKVNHRYL